MKNLLKDRVYWLEVWIRFQSGDQAAFSEIYQEFMDSLFAYGSKISRDRELVKDCIHDVFIELHRLKPDLHHPEYIEFYLYKSFRNAIFHKTKENKRTQSMALEDMVNFDLQFNIEQDSLDLESNSLRVEKLKRILQTLNPQKRELLFLKFTTGLNYVEIGHLLGQNSDTIKKQVYRTLNQLWEKYGNQLMELMMIFGRKKEVSRL